MNTQDLFLPGEVWKDVVGYEGLYQVSNFGRVKNIYKLLFGRIKVNDKIMTPQISKCGYLTVCITKEKNKKTLTVHRLVALAFIPNTENKREVNHIDGNKTNNAVDNLEWMTSSENQIHAYENGLNAKSFGSNNGQAKLKEEDILEIVRLFNSNVRNKLIQDRFNIGQQNISSIITGKPWSHITGIKYERKGKRYKRNFCGNEN